jgi:hypothetical protein
MHVWQVAAPCRLEVGRYFIGVLLDHANHAMALIEPFLTSQPDQPSSCSHPKH